MWRSKIKGTRAFEAINKCFKGDQHPSARDLALEDWLSRPLRPLGDSTTNLTVFTCLYNFAPEKTPSAPLTFFEKRIMLKKTNIMKSLTRHLKRNKETIWKSKDILLTFGSLIDKTSFVNVCWILYVHTRWNCVKMSSKISYLYQYRYSFVINVDHCKSVIVIYLNLG